MARRRAPTGRTGHRSPTGIARERETSADDAAPCQREGPPPFSPGGASAPCSRSIGLTRTACRRPTRRVTLTVLMASSPMSHVGAEPVRRSLPASPTDRRSTRTPPPAVRVRTGPHVASGIVRRTQEPEESPRDRWRLRPWPAPIPEESDLADSGCCEMGEPDWLAAATSGRSLSASAKPLSYSPRGQIMGREFSRAIMRAP